jgi:quinolinate synthase
MTATEFWAAALLTKRSDKMGELENKILDLKKKRNAVILAHNYQPGEVQDIADYVGDSLGLAIEASKTKAETIIFCGVHFMAETAFIINPSKTVVMPDLKAGCPMADMITAADLIAEKKKFPNATTVAYVNTSAAVKAESNICVTSANAVAVVQSLKDAREILFVPDMYLGNYVSRHVPDKKFIFWNGYCPIHVAILAEDIKKLKAKHPKACVMVHPECRPDVVDLADKVLSTGGMVSHAKTSNAKEFIVATEIGMLHRLKKDNPGKIFIPASERAVCPNMKATTPEKVLWALEEMKNKITVQEDIRVRAEAAIRKMLEIA